MTDEMSTSQKIARLNDLFRANLHIYMLGITSGRIVTTAAINALPEEDKMDILKKVWSHNEFTEDNDPYGEHDFGAFYHKGEKIFWKIDYYDLAMKFHSEDPADPEKTIRVLTIMYGYEY